MLLEVPFINGFNEFIEYFSKEISIDLPSDYNLNFYKIELLEYEVLEGSVTYSNILSLNLDFKISIEKEDKTYFVYVLGEEALNNLKLSVQYTYKNINPKDLYSVDYDRGLVYFSEPTTVDYEIEYDFDNILCTGKAATQLVAEDFNMVSGNINIKNYKENSLLFFLYRKNEIIHRNLTPVLKDLKLNYIIKDDISL